MNHSVDIGEIEHYFPFLAQVAPALRAQVAQQAIVRTIPAGQTIFWEGDSCSHLALVLSGSVRVYKVGETGREITLYRIEARESCILTASCILSQAGFPALAVTESEVRALLVPATLLRAWVAQDEGWRDYVVGVLAQRLAMVIATVEEIAFRRVDARIADYLLLAAANGARVCVTHQAIALELGTAREVVSRILKDLERAGGIRLGRGEITILDAEVLRMRARVV